MADTGRIRCDFAGIPRNVDTARRTVATPVVELNETNGTLDATLVKANASDGTGEAAAIERKEFPETAGATRLRADPVCIAREAPTFSPGASVRVLAEMTVNAGAG
jgi:hypothetical protein